MTPQFTYDNKGNAVGVFLSIEDWNHLKKNLLVEELPKWQKEILDHRMTLIQQNPGNVMLLEDFITEMERDAREEV